MVYILMVNVTIYSIHGSYGISWSVKLPIKKSSIPGIYFSLLTLVANQAWRHRRSDDSMNPQSLISWYLFWRRSELFKVVHPVVINGDLMVI